MPLDELTIVLPIFSRVRLLRRTLEYFASRNLSASIIIADSSPPALQARNRRVVDRLGSRLRIEYRTYPPAIVQADKMRDAVLRAATPYLAMAADDDFFSVGALERATAFLSANPDYSVAHGEALAFELAGKTDGAHGRIRLLTEYPQRGVEQASAAERLVNYLAAYATIWFSVHRTAMAQENWKIVAQVNFELLFVELFFAALDIIQGKAKQLGGLYMVRQSHSVKDYNLKTWAEGKEGDHQREQFCEILGERIAAADGIGLPAAIECARYALSLYLHAAGFESRAAERPSGAPAVSPDALPRKLAPPLELAEGRYPSRFWSPAAARARGVLRLLGARHADRPRPDLGPWAHLADEFGPIYEAIRGHGA